MNACHGDKRTIDVTPVALSLHGNCPHVEYLRHDFIGVNVEPHVAREELSSDHETSVAAAQ